MRVAPDAASFAVFLSDCGALPASNGLDIRCCWWWCCSAVVVDGPAASSRMMSPSSTSRTNVGLCNGPAPESTADDEGSCGLCACATMSGMSCFVWRSLTRRGNFFKMGLRLPKILIAVTMPRLYWSQWYHRRILQLFYEKDAFSNSKVEI